MEKESQLSVAEYKNRFTELLRRVEAGQTHVITRHGRPVVRVTSIRQERSVKAVIGSIRAHRVRGKKDLKKLIAKGRA